MLNILAVMLVNAVRPSTLEAVWWWANEADRLSCNTTCHTACTLSADNSEAIGLNITHGKLHIVTITDGEQCREQQVTLPTARCVLALSNRTRHKQHCQACSTQEVRMLQSTANAFAAATLCGTGTKSCKTRAALPGMLSSTVQQARHLHVLTTNDRGCCRPRQGTVLLLHCVPTLSKQIRQERHCQAC